MPLVRVALRNEYALGAPELYREANKEEPKEILEGVTVAGLVGVLHQLGDLAEFAAEVFHGLQEEVMIASSRSHKLIARVQRIEAALSPLEKAVLAQRSHLHFAYTAGSNWHSRIQYEKDHFVYSDMPQFIMDSYEDCRGPPRLHLLDRFDPGGPGSCLKRYSDPTFFKRASVASGEASTDKVSKDKKGCKIKKRRLWSGNGEVSRGASFSYQSGRVQFTQLNVGEHTSPCQTMSTYDASLRSHLSEQSNLDLRNGSGYTEGDFLPSYSIQPKEQESRESITSPAKRHESDFVYYGFLEEKVTNACDDILISLTQEQDARNSYSVTLDEKIGTLEPRMQDYDQDGMAAEEDPDRNLESSSPECAANLEVADKIIVQTCNQALQTLESGDIHHHDIENEADPFMDALNTIESESETDIDCMRKPEVENYPKLENEAVEDGLPELIIHSSEYQTSNSESHGSVNISLINGSSGHKPIPVSPKSSPAAYSSTNRVAAVDEFNSISPVDKALLSAQRAGESSNPSSLQNTDSRATGNTNDGMNVESVSCSVSANFRDDGTGMPISDETRSTPHSQKPAPETSNVISVTFWTNGGLLGLQPSKPPDCSVLNSLPQDPVSKKDGKISSSCQLLSDKDGGKPEETESSKNIQECLNTDSSTYQEYQESSRSFSGKSGDSLYPNNASSTGSNATASVNSECQAAKQNSRRSYRMFELSNRLLTTGSNKKLLPGGEGNSRHGSYQNVNAFEQKNNRPVAHQTFSGQTKDLFGGKSLTPSPSSSPPLEHMKISFQPIDGFEISKLKLKFPSENTNTESSRDVFPSFQLVPEVLIPQHNVGSDSDDDTFYRASPSLSDDCHSLQSESNSEQWESGESPSRKDHDLHDSLRRISLTESVSTVPENERTSNHDNCGLKFPFIENGVQNSQSCRWFDLQSLDMLNHSFGEELRNDANLKDLVEPQFAPTPAPPALPPVQWRSMMPHLDDIEDRCKVMPEGSNCAFDLKHSASTISQKPKPAPFNHDQNFETTNVQKSKQFGSQKSNGLKEAIQGKSIDEKVDFLHQIRAKSFSLRPTVAAKPTVTSGDPANVQVTAILEKANAIRQAVGSDDGEDDGNWSDDT